MPGLTIANVGFLGSAKLYTTPTYVGGYTAGFVSTGTTAVIPLNSLSGGSNTSPSIGDLVLISFAQTTDNVDIDLSATNYNEIVDLFSADTLDTNLYVGYKYLTAADSSLTVNCGASTTTGSSVALQVWRNSDTSTFSNTTTVSVANSAHVRVQSVDTTLPNSIVVAIGAGSDNTSTGYTNSSITNVITSRGNNAGSGFDSIIGMGYVVASTPGTITLGTFTSSNTSTQDSAISASIIIPPL